MPEQLIVAKTDQRYQCGGWETEIRDGEDGLRLRREQGNGSTLGSADLYLDRDQAMALMAVLNAAQFALSARTGRDI